jgi:dTDP-4-dehydrorhamnose reductase
MCVTMQKILILGVSGMLGNAAYRLFASSPGWHVTGTARSTAALAHLPRSDTARIVSNIDVTDMDRLVRLLAAERPVLVLNCVGVIKQLAAAKDPVVSLEINSLFPHKLAHLCALSEARLVHVSTDCVFNGRGSMYAESDFPDAEDLYGRTKLLGEVDYPNAITLRTSIIGHEISSTTSLIDWFLSQPGPTVKGYTKAIYSGLPTVELARIIRDVVAPRPHLHGLWHVASHAITKYDLLRIVAEVYGKQVELIRDDSVAIDRSMDGSRFAAETGYVVPPWVELVRDMHAAR